MTVSVLVVDDDDGFRRLAVGMLRATGHDRVHEAATAASALSEAVRNHPDVALVDVGLPDSDGLELASELARLEDPPRIVLISADGDAADDSTARRVGAECFVAKQDLAEARLRDLLDGL